MAGDPVAISARLCESQIDVRIRRPYRAGGYENPVGHPVRGRYTDREDQWIGLAIGNWFLAIGDGGRLNGMVSRNGLRCTTAVMPVNSQYGIIRKDDFG